MSESIVVDETPLQSEPITETQDKSSLDEFSSQRNIQENSEPEQIQDIDGNQDIPKKYAGKSMSEVIEMHQNVEQALGKQGAELGEQRKLMQSLIEAQNKVTETTPPEEPVIQEDNFFDDPVEAVNKAIENHPDVIKAREERMGNMQKHNLETLDKEYPDWQKTVQNSDFQKFIGDSATRTEMFRKADVEYRSDLAIELFDWYSKTKMSGATQEAVAEEKSKIESAMKKTTGESRSSGDSVGGKKVYRRADLINLQVTDPNRYATLADEIQEAYAEGRVK
jgi:hypothetical protein